MAFKAPFNTFAEFPTLGNTTGDLRAALDDGKIYRWSGSAWVFQSTLINNLYFQIPGSGGGSGNLDGGSAYTTYGGTSPIDGGNA